MEQNSEVNKFDTEDYSKRVSFLMLGKTGSGKTTLMNAIANHLYKKKFEDEKLVLIPQKKGQECSFSEYIQEVDPKEFPDEENFGNSKTQTTRSYRLQFEDRALLLIDTPGIGDTRGFQQDKINIDNIIEGIRKHSFIQAVVLVIEPNSRTDMMFKYYIDEIRKLLTIQCLNQFIVVCTRNNGDVDDDIIDTFSKGLGFRPPPENWFCMENRAPKKSFWNLAAASFNNMYQLAASFPKILTKDIEDLFLKRRSIEENIQKMIISIELYKVGLVEKLKKGKTAEILAKEIEDYIEREGNKKNSLPTYFLNYNCKTCHKTCMVDSSGPFFNFFRQKENCKVCSHSWDQHDYEQKYLYVGLHQNEVKKILESVENLLVNCIVRDFFDAVAAACKDIIEGMIDEIAKLTIDIEKLGVIPVSYDSFLYYLEGSIAVIEQDNQMEVEEKREKLKRLESERDYYLQMRKRYLQALDNKEAIRDEINQEYKKVAEAGC